jgi:hypothetical protein
VREVSDRSLELDALLRRIFEEKARRRRERARLGIEEKITILVALQRLGNEIRIARGRTPLPEWKI